MTPSRSTALALAIGSALAVAGCNQPAKPVGDAADKGAATAAKTGDADAGKIAGLATDKEQASYMVGMDMAKTLEPIKDEIDVDTMTKAVKASLAGEKLLLSEEQAQKIRESFSKKLQEKRAADDAAKATRNEADGKAFLADNANKPGVKTTASGLQYQVITEGKGPKPKATDMVLVHYKGSLLDGKVFDSSYERNEPAQIPLPQVVPGWREGIQLMPVGSKYKLWIPAVLAYGAQGTPGGPIPPNATLAFEIELLDIAKGGKPPQPPAK